MTYGLRFLQIARDDLIALHAWIEAEADIAIADSYLERIEARCCKLTEFPNRGTPRDHLTPGARSVIFERRISIFYRLEGSIVEILRVVSGARETEALFN